MRTRLCSLPTLTFAFVLFYLTLILCLKHSDYYEDFLKNFEIFSTSYYEISFIFFIIANTFYLVITILGWLNAKNQHADKLTKIDRYLTPLKSIKPISILIPCYNEEVGIVESLQSILHFDYPEYELIVCNDGSKDNSMEVLHDAFKLKKIEMYPPHFLKTKEVKAIYRSETYHNLFVIDKVNGGKADALNAAINMSQYPLICCIDADSVVDPHGLLNLAMPFIEDDRVIATGGTILTAHTLQQTSSYVSIQNNIPFTWLGMIQTVEYIRAFFIGRLGWDYLNCDPIISGAFGLFKKSLVIKVGGYATKTIGEDMELNLRLQSYCKQNRIPHVVKLLPVPVCWTEPPSDMQTLANQRIRWNQGLSESLWIHRNMIFRSWAGSLGMIGLPYFLLFELLAAPVELIGYLCIFTGIFLGVYNPYAIGIFISLTIVFGCILNLTAVFVDQITFKKYKTVRDVFYLILGSCLEHFGFRQLHLIWRITGIVRWLRGKQSWGDMKRKGFRAR